jgi:replicative DNA helicase
MRDRQRNGRRGGRRDDLPLGYFDAREAAYETQEIRDLMEFSPSNFEAEAALLGALMIDNRLVENVQTIVKSEHFFEPVHGRIYGLILTLTGKGRLATPVTLHPYFEGESFEYPQENGDMVAFSLPAYLAKCTGSGAGLIGWRQFAEQIRDLALTRDIITMARDMILKAKDTAESIEPQRIIADVEERIFELSQGIATDAASTSTPIGAAWDDTMAELDGIASGGPVPGFEINGYEDFNQVCGRLEEEDYMLLGGRPSMGKTGVACAIAVGAAAAGEATEFLSLEMTKRRITRRIIANVIYRQNVTSGYSALSTGKLTKVDREEIARARDMLAKAPLNIADPDEMNVEEFYGFLMRRKRYWAKRGKVLKLVVVDYLDRFGTAKPFRTDTERVSYISRTIKGALKKAKVAGVVLVQLSRAVEQRDDKRPHLSDLRQSGSLEQDADIVAFVYRDEYYLRQSEPPASNEKKHGAWQDEMIAARDRLEFYSTKRREGALSKRTGYFFADAQAVRPSTFYRSDLYGDENGRFDFGKMTVPGSDGFGGMEG